MRVRIIGSGLTAVVCGTFLAATAFAGPASADVGTCVTHYFCVYTDGYFGGTQWSHSGTDSYQAVPADIHDQGSSWINANTNQAECVYDHVNGTLVYLDNVDAGQKVGKVPSGANDKIDAIGYNQIPMSPC